MKVERVEALGAVCAFKPKGVIQVLGSTYDKVPELKMADFEAVLGKTREAYEAKVAEVKARGERPKASQLKSEAISEVLEPFLVSIGLEKKAAKSPTRVVKSKNPRVPEDTKVKASPELTEEEKKAAEEAYDNNFPEEILDDSEEKFEGTEDPFDGFDDAEDPFASDEADLDFENL